MDTETKMNMIKKLPTEEIITEGDLGTIFENYEHPKHYIGFEVSGMLHIGSGLSISQKINDFVEAGVKTNIFLADYHAWINGKLNGDLKTIQKVALGYFKHAFISLGLNEDKTNYILASSIYDNNYWADVLNIAKDTTLKRMLRTVTIQGRKETDSLKSAAVMYSAMQVADIYKLDVQIAQAGMDQRKVHVLARELMSKFNRKFVAVHGHIIPGLKGPKRMNETGITPDVLDVKMSKSKPDTAVFIHDSPEEIKRKIKKAYCPEKITKGNPIFEIAKYLILRNKPLEITRPAKFGGDLTIQTGVELSDMYANGKLHPTDLKSAVSIELIDMLKPVRDYFEKNKGYLEQIQGIKISR